MRPPYTDDWVCRVHKRKGSDPDEATCPAYLFAPVDEVQAADTEVAAQIEAARAAVTKRYRKRPEPPEVKATPFGALMLVSTGTGPEFPVPRDQFFATYEEIEEPREEAAHALEGADATNNEPPEAS